MTQNVDIHTEICTVIYLVQKFREKIVDNTYAYANKGRAHDLH